MTEQQVADARQAELEALAARHKAISDRNRFRRLGAATSITEYLVANVPKKG